MDHNALRNTTNSPPLLPILYFKEDRRQNTDLLSSEESYHSSFTEIKDNIYNAERVVSDIRITDGTNIIRSLSHSLQIDLPTSVEQDNPFSKQAIDAVSSTSEFVIPVMESVNGREVRRSEKVLKIDHKPHLRHSEPLPTLSRSPSIDGQLRSSKSLDCLPLGKDGLVKPKSWTDKLSPSSEESLAAALCIFLFPLMPCRPPISRRPTPPGLPPFGTTEAQELRLTPASQSKLAKFGRRILGYIIADDSSIQQRRDNQATAQVGAHQQHTNVPADMLKRMLGIARPATLPVGSYETGRSKLPKGVKIAATTGALIQADDGTYVRGRWGPRTSGHGIGQRSIGVHPFARLRDSSVIDEAVREIDKAHERDQARARRGQSRDVPTGGPSHLETSNAHIYNPDGVTISPHRLRTSTMPNISSAKRSAHLGHNSVPSQSSYQMIEPHPYSTQTERGRAVDRIRTENSTDGGGYRNTGGVIENQVAIDWLQSCWEWTCRPCNHFLFPKVKLESSDTHNIR